MMKTILFYIKKRALLFCFLLISLNYVAQSTLATYRFTNNLNADEPSQPSLTYYNSAGVIVVPGTVGGVIYVNQYWIFGGSRMLETDDNGSYIQVLLNTTGLSNINVEFTGEMLKFLFASREKGRLSLLVDYTGTGSSFSSSLLDIDLNTGGGAFDLYDTETKSINLSAAADNNPNLLIRIKVGGYQGVGSLDGEIRIDNLIITSKSPKILVAGYNTPTNLKTIPENAPAATLYGTDFGIVITDDPNAATKTFQIKNDGTAPLVISNISFSGANYTDFLFVPNPATPLPVPDPTNPINSFPATIAKGNYGEFAVKFNPSGDGKRTALLDITSNADPSPYSFYVEGRGATCATDELALRRNTMEISQPVNELLAANPVLSSFNKISGKNGQNAHNTPITPFNNMRLYDHTTLTGVNLFSSSNTSWYTTNGTSTVEFGPVSLTNENGVYISFNLAAFSSNTGTTFLKNDYVQVQVYTPVTAPQPNIWSPVLTVYGNNTSNSLGTADSRYSFAGGLTAIAEYDGDLTPASFYNDTGITKKYSKVKVKVQGTSNIDDLLFRIVAYNNNGNKLWLVDDVAVYSAATVTRKWSATGQWLNRYGNPDTVPNKNIKAIIDANYNTTTNGNINACECEVNSGKNLTVTGSGIVTLQNKLVNYGDGTNVIIQSDGNLIQVENDAVNSGNITAERSVSHINNLPTRMDYVYWSSPVAEQKLRGTDAEGGFSPGTPYNRFYQYAEPTDFFTSTPDINFIPAKGYAIRAEGAPLLDDYSKTYKFKGVPNNGDISINIDRSPNQGVIEHGYNLIGNPYPSNINFDELFTANSLLIYNSAWFWTNNWFTASQQGSNYTVNNYAIYNGSGGNPATSDPSNPFNITAVPNGIVKVGQGFIIQKRNVGGPGSLNFKNSYGKLKDLRVATPGTFYQKDSTPKNRFWLKLISPDDMVNTQLIGYVDGATDGFEQDYDAEIMGMSSDIFYSKLDDKRLLIQGKGDFETTDKVNLGANFFKSGTYTLALDIGEGIFSGSQKVYLKDYETGTLTDLSVNQYTFEAAQGISEGRFEIIYEPQQVLLSEDAAIDNLIVYRDGGDFVVRAQSIKISDLEVYDGSGRLIYKTQPRHTEVRIPGDKLLRGVYILKIDQNGQLTKKKILK